MDLKNDLPPPDHLLAQLRVTVLAMHPLPEADWQAFAAIWAPFSAKRKEVLTAAGEPEKYLYFVGAGVQRVYYFDDADREATLVFTYAPSFGGVLDSLLLLQPAKYTYETLTPSEFLRAPAAELARLIAARPTIGDFVRQGVTASLGGVLERLVELQCMPAEERFRKLLRRSPHLLQLVPQKYLANYLGIDAARFSKLLHQVRI